MPAADRLPNFATALWIEAGKCRCLTSTMRRRLLRRWGDIIGWCCEDLPKRLNDCAVVSVGVAEVDGSLEQSFMNVGEGRLGMVAAGEFANQAHVLLVLRQSSLWGIFGRDHLRA